MKYLTTEEQKKFLVDLLTNKHTLDFSDKEYIQSFLKTQCEYYYDGIRERINKIISDNNIITPIDF